MSSYIMDIKSKTFDDADFDDVSFDEIADRRSGALQ